jgi:hypothetical protein
MCTLCNTTGWIVATKKEGGGIYGFRCSCYKANYLSKTIPAWNSHRYSSDFLPDNQVNHAPLPDFKMKASDPEASKPLPEYDLEDLPF